MRQFNCINCVDCSSQQFSSFGRTGKVMNDSERRESSLVNQCLSAAICCMLAFSYGNTIGWSSAAVPQLERGGPDLPVDDEGIDSETSDWIGAAYCLGAVVTSPIFGLLADKAGRKFAGYMVGLGFIVHWILIGFGTDIHWILAGRAIGGAGGAGSITVASIYNNEISEQRIRGALCSFMALFYVFGIFFSYIMGAFFTFYTICYTYLGISIFFMLAWWWMPESPAYLVLKGKDEEAIKAIAWLRSIPTKDAMEPLLEIKLQQAGAKEPASVVKFFLNASARRGLFLSATITSVQTFCGIFAIHTYASSVFDRAGGALDPFIATLVYGLSMCLGAAVPPLFVDRVGRKVLLGWSCFGLSICMAVMGVYFWSLRSGLIENDSEYIAWTLLPVAVLSACVVIYYIGLGSVTYITMAELFTDENRGVAGSFIAVTIWATSFVLLLFFAPAARIFGDHMVFYFFSGVSIFGALFVYVFIPETKGKNSIDIAEGLVKKPK